MQFALRKAAPGTPRAYLYPAWENVRRYILHVRRRKEGAHIRWLEETSKAARVQQQQAELEMQIARGKLVDPEELYQELAPRMLKVRQALEATLATGRVPRVEIDRIAGIIGDTSDLRPDRNGDTPGR